MNHTAAATGHASVCARPRASAFAAVCLPLFAAGVLLHTSTPVAAAEAAEPVIAAPLERLSDAPWKLARKREPLRDRLKLELTSDNLTPRPALDFQNAPKSTRMPVGTLRMALSERSSLSFRPRSHGGMHVTYREAF